MRELGQRLRERREALGLDLDTLESRTKIRKRYLIALEEGNWSILPGTVYARGFVRSYAEALGLDGMDLLRDYVDKPVDNPGAPAERAAPAASSAGAAVDATPLPAVPEQDGGELPRQTADAAPSKPKRAAPVAGQSSDRKGPPTKLLATRRFSGISQVAVVVGALVIIIVVWLAVRHSAANPNASPNNVIAGSPPANIPATSNGAENSTGNAIGADAGNNTTTNGTGGATSVGGVQIAAQPFANNQQTYFVTSAQPLSVTLSAVNGACWVSVSADGSVVDGSDLLGAGQSKTWTASHTITIRVGSVPNAQIQINGEPVTLPASNYPMDVTITKQP